MDRAPGLWIQSAHLSQAWVCICGEGFPPPSAGERKSCSVEKHRPCLMLKKSDSSASSSKECTMISHQAYQAQKTYVVTGLTPSSSSDTALSAHGSLWNSLLGAGIPPHLNSLSTSASFHQPKSVFIPGPWIHCALAWCCIFSTARYLLMFRDSLCSPGWP